MAEDFAVKAQPPTPAWELKTTKPLVHDVSTYTTQVTYEDEIEHHASSIEAVFEDRERLWQNQWFPVQGAVLELKIGYADALVTCGKFQIDEFGLDGPPDAFKIKGISAYITPSMRTHKSRAFENQTLLGIATTVAKTHDLEVIGAPQDVDVQLKRMTQKHETDLQFLQRAANTYDYNFSIRDKQLVFVPRAYLEAQDAAITIRRPPDVEKFSFVHGSHKLYKTATVSYLDSDTKLLTTQTAEETEDIPTGDELRLPIRAESGQDALAKANAGLRGHNRKKRMSSLTVIGDTRLRSGVAINVAGFGKFDGKYLIEKSRHTLDRRGGYTTEIEMRHVTAEKPKTGGPQQQVPIDLLTTTP